MAITGGVKFFDNNKMLFSKGASAAASSGDIVSDYAIDRNPSSYWISVGSDDTTAETLEITFPNGAQTIDRLFILDHNLKDFKIEWDNASVWTAFSNVLGIDGTKAGIVETTFSENTCYYEFDAVTTSKIKITMNKTQVVDAEKYINQVIATEELGTLQGFPEISSVDSDRNERKKKMLSGKMLVIKSEESFSTKLSFKKYPALYSSDLDLMVDLFEKETNFLVWLCGGKYGSNNFRYALRGFRLQDLKTVQMIKAFKVKYDKNIYINGVNFSVNFEEVVD